MKAGGQPPELEVLKLAQALKLLQTLAPARPIEAFKPK
jgi:hypothetical protein